MAQVVRVQCETEQEAKLLAACDGYATEVKKLAQRVAELKAPFRNVDTNDWDWLMEHLGYSGHGQFWKAVLTDMRKALASN